MKLNKSYLSNTVSLIIIFLSFFVNEELSLYLLSIGLFAFSGALTNTIAIHMLFEKVPFLYGSGVISLKFELFKASIGKMIMKEFLTLEHIEKFTSLEEVDINLKPVFKKIDLKPAFNAVVELILNSPLGSMLGMFGGEKVIRQFEKPFDEKMRNVMIEISEKEEFKALINEHIINENSAHKWFEKIETLVLLRLEDLTPTMVKEMIKKIIQEHLGWLVVWGAIFGALIGFISAFFI